MAHSTAQPETESAEEVLRDWNLVKKGFNIFYRDWHQDPKNTIFVPEFLIIPEEEVEGGSQDGITEYYALSKVYSALQKVQRAHKLGGIFVARFDAMKIFRKVKGLEKDLHRKKLLLNNWRTWAAKRGGNTAEDNVLIMHPQLGIVLLAINAASYGSESFQEREEIAMRDIGNVKEIFWHLISILTPSEQSDIDIEGIYCLPETSVLTDEEPNRIYKEDIADIEKFSMFWTNRIRESVNKHGERNYYKDASFQKLARFIVSYRSSVIVSARNAHETYPHSCGPSSERESSGKSIFCFNPRQLSGYLSVNKHQILFGLPGTGKTLLLELLATEANHEKRRGKVLIVTGGERLLKRYNLCMAGHKHSCKRDRQPVVQKNVDLTKVSNDDDFFTDEMQSLSSDWLKFLQERSRLKGVFTVVAVSGRAWATDVEEIMASAKEKPELKGYLLLNLTTVIRGTLSIIHYWSNKYLTAIPSIGHRDQGIAVDDRDVEGTTGGVLLQVKKHLLHFLEEDNIAPSDVAVITFNKWAAQDIVDYLKDQNIAARLAENGGMSYVQVDYNNNVLSQEYPAVIVVNYYGYSGTSESTEFTALTRAITRLVVIRKDRMIMQWEIDKIMLKPENQDKLHIKMADIVKEAAENLYEREKTAMEWKNSLNAPIKDWDRSLNATNYWDQSLAELRYNVLPDILKDNDYFSGCKVFSDAFQVLIDNDDAIKDFLMTHVPEDHPFYSYEMALIRLEENDYESALGPGGIDVQNEDMRRTLLQFLNRYFRSLKDFLKNASLEERSKNYVLRQDMPKWQPFIRTVFTLGNSIEQKKCYKETP